MPSKLEQLRTMTDVVADTGDVDAIRRFAPLDATTNPSLLLKAAAMPQYDPHLIEARRRAAASRASSSAQAALFCDTLAVLIGHEITQIVPGRVSTEVDARLSFDSAQTIDRAKFIIEQYAALGVPAERILIKIAATWEGIKAAEALERANINCNLTLLFGFDQALACADAGVFLISPFVGRILDWYSAHTGKSYNSATDPGVQSVQRIYAYYKTHGYQTVVMGASFRNIGQIEALAGCDRLTISPDLMVQLDNDATRLERVLDPKNLLDAPTRIASDEGSFRWGLNEDPMATEKLAEGIRTFAADQVTLEGYLAG